MESYIHPWSFSHRWSTFHHNQTHEAGADGNPHPHNHHHHHHHHSNNASISYYSPHSLYSPFYLPPVRQSQLPNFGGSSTPPPPLLPPPLKGKPTQGHIGAFDPSGQLLSQLCSSSSSSSSPSSSALNNSNGNNINSKSETLASSSSSSSTPPISSSSSSSKMTSSSQSINALFQPRSDFYASYINCSRPAVTASTTTCNTTPATETTSQHQQSHSHGRSTNSKQKLLSSEATPEMSCDTVATSSGCRTTSVLAENGNSRMEESPSPPLLPLFKSRPPPFFFDYRSMSPLSQQQQLSPNHLQLSPSQQQQQLQQQHAQWSLNGHHSHSKVMSSSLLYPGLGNISPLGPHSGYTNPQQYLSPLTHNTHHHGGNPTAPHFFGSGTPSAGDLFSISDCLRTKSRSSSGY